MFLPEPDAVLGMLLVLGESTSRRLFLIRLNFKLRVYLPCAENVQLTLAASGSGPFWMIFAPLNDPLRAYFFDSRSLFLDFWCYPSHGRQELAGSTL
jgi:hypothetical protein